MQEPPVTRNQIFKFFYQNVAKRIFFLLDAEFVHSRMIEAGEFLGSNPLTQKLTSAIFSYKSDKLNQKIAGINFKNPIGLAAGFDYEARLTQILPFVGFGFHTVGTITNMPYEGNPSPLLGRLPKSRSLLVNKGFKNEGIKKVCKDLKKLDFLVPVGISIGRTNSPLLKTEAQSIVDICKAFKEAEKSKLKNAYYELNISCPNLFGKITFYPPKNLEKLLSSIDRLKLLKPVFIKMPIERSDKETLAMLSVIVKHKITGVIFGNLQKDRSHKTLDQKEVAKFKRGYFSGKPTQKRSNELIALCYKKYKKRLVIIGCGGVFCDKDAYKKIKLGASLVQLITGMIFEGPQLISSINMGLVKLMKKDGFKNISEAIGSGI